MSTNPTSTPLAAAVTLLDRAEPEWTARGDTAPSSLDDLAIWHRDAQQVRIAAEMIRGESSFDLPQLAPLEPASGLDPLELLTAAPDELEEVPDELENLPLFLGRLWTSDVLSGPRSGPTVHELSLRAAGALAAAAIDRCELAAETGGHLLRRPDATAPQSAAVTAQWTWARTPDGPRADAETTSEFNALFRTIDAAARPGRFLRKPTRRHRPAHRRAHPHRELRHPRRDYPQLPSQLHVAGRTPPPERTDHDQEHPDRGAEDGGEYASRVRGHLAAAAPSTSDLLTAGLSEDDRHPAPPGRPRRRRASRRARRRQRPRRGRAAMSAQALGILHAVDRRLDDTRDLPDPAMEQGTGLERSLRDHEYTVNDLHWNAASPSRARNAAKAARNSVRPFAPPSATGRDGLLQARTATMTDAASGMAHGGWIPAAVRICWAGTCRGGAYKPAHADRPRARGTPRPASEKTDDIAPAERGSSHRQLSSSARQRTINRSPPVYAGSTTFGADPGLRQENRHG